MLKDDIAYPGISGGCHRRVVIATEEPGSCVEPESLDAAVDGQVGSIVGLKRAVTELRPFDVSSHQLVGERVVAPERVAQEVHQVQPVPSGGDAGILEVLPGVGALLNYRATGRHDHHAETVENADVTRLVDGFDDGVGTLNIDGDP